MAHRKEVFQSKVLQRLFPATPKSEPSTPGVGNPSKPPSVNRKASGRPATSSSTGAAKTLSTEAVGKRMYTVLPPPEDYKADSEGSSTPLQLESTRDEDTAEESRDDANGDSEQDKDNEPKSRRRKRRKKKPGLRPDCGKDRAALASEPGEALGQARRPEGAEGVSKNKKRKLKKKRRKEKLLSLGLVPQAAAVEFTYRKDDGGGGDDSGRSLAEVSDFLRSTMKLYMSDSPLPADELRLRSGTLEDLLSGVAAGGRPASVLKQLSALQAFVQRREPGKLEEALQELRSAPSLSEGEAAAVGALLRYWIADVLPASGGEEAGLSEVGPGGRQSP